MTPPQTFESIDIPHELVKREKLYTQDMSFAPVYLANRFFFRLSAFFRHWYIDGSRFFERLLAAMRKRSPWLALFAVPLAIIYAAWLAAPFYALFMAYSTLLR
jgi:hypothetical protein